MDTRIPGSQKVDIPRLEHGDTLPLGEFRRRCAAMPDPKKAELVEGEVYLPSSSPPEHGDAHALLGTWLKTYRSRTAHLETRDRASVLLDLDNLLRPDSLLMIRPGQGGSARFGENDLIQGAPELIAEVALSRVSLDAWKKPRVYRRSGVREFILWRIEDVALDWFVLRDGRFDPLPPGKDGILRSEVFPGLWLDRDALLREDLPRVEAILGQGIASAEHTAFVDRLNRR
ncbi:Uma2 family endonuclease [Aquisphaera insulae]|uniref:Uma2 family endonuclease n=1 Tax=Aquisphaera insulae TaxID=2712864 RepID=UPI0013EB4EC9|nr:Uma2 family endonuclease [Aquisphaera insulae]